MLTSTWWGAALGAVLGGAALLVASARRPRSASAQQKHRAGGIQRLRAWLAHSGDAALSPALFLCASGVCAVLAGALAEAVFGVPAFALTLACAVGGAPWALVAWRGRVRRSATRAAWPDAVDHLVAAARSGVALPEAVAALATVGPEGARAAVARFARNYRSAGDFAGACRLLKDELADPVFDRVAETLVMAREVGGTELVAVLRALAAALREDAATRGELSARQGWVVNAARLGVAAPWLVLAMLTTRPEGREAYSTPAGTVVIAGAAVVTLLAYRAMVAIGRLPEERRWFR